MRGNIKKKNQSSKKETSNIKSKLFLYFYLFIIILAMGEIFLIKSFKFEKEKVINYKENSDINYKVYLKENNFYEEKYLGKDMVYIASLIDKIAINFDYDFDIDTPVNLDFTYSIIGKLIITNGKETNGVEASKNNKFLEKEYKLLNETTINLNNKKHLDITEPITIDYAKYNKISNLFRSTYGIETKSKLVVYLLINQKNNPSETKYIVNQNNQMSITIPLSESSVDITMDYKEINSSRNIIGKKNLSFNNAVFFIISIILISLSIIYFRKGFKLLNTNTIKRNSYDKYIAKLLREYDRLIVETSDIPSFKNKQIINVHKFNELLDVRDNLKLPIMYYIKKEHQQGYFYINDGDTLYLNTIDITNLEKKNEK